MSESLYQILSFKLCPYGMKIPEIVNNYNICNETTAQLDEDFGGCVVKMRIPVKVGVIKDINLLIPSDGNCSSYTYKVPTFRHRVEHISNQVIVKEVKEQLIREILSRRPFVPIDMLVREEIENDTTTRICYQSDFDKYIFDQIEIGISKKRDNIFDRELDIEMEDAFNNYYVWKAFSTL